MEVEVEVEVEAEQNTVVGDVYSFAVDVLGKKAGSVVVGMMDPKFQELDQMIGSMAHAEVERVWYSARTGFVAEPEVIYSAGRGVVVEH